MRTCHSLILSLTVGAAFTFASPFVHPAAAYQCQEIAEYADMWDDSEDANAVLGLFGRGIADGGGEPCGVTVRTFMTGPDSNELSSTYGYGTGYAESVVATYLDPNGSVAEGNYQTATEAWSQGVHYGCSYSPVSAILASIGHYRLIQTLANGRAVYSRCDTGPCLVLTLLVSNSPPPPYALVLVITIGYAYDPNTCFGGFGTAWGPCT